MTTHVIEPITSGSPTVGKPVPMERRSPTRSGPVSEVAIRTEQLGRSFDGVAAVADVNVRIERGSIVGLLGPNGSGKTTLIRMLSTLLRPTTGHAWIDGADVQREPSRVRRSIGLTGQYAAVDEFLTGKENLRLIGRLLGMSAASARSRADELLKTFALSDAGDRRLSTYSGGMRRRLDLALSLTSRPDIVFLDEPTTGLDPRSRFALWEVIEQLGRDGTTVLLCTQYLEEADHLAERVIILDRGTIAAEGTPAELRADVGGSLISFTLADLEDAPVAAAAVQPIASAVVTPVSGSPHIEVPVTTADRLADVVRRLDCAGVEFTDLGVHEPTLDDVFLALTGRAPAPVPAESEAS